MCGRRQCPRFPRYRMLRFIANNDRDNAPTHVNNKLNLQYIVQHLPYTLIVLYGYIT